MTTEAEFYRDVLEMIATGRNSISQRLASSALNFMDSMKSTSPHAEKWEKQLKSFVFEESVKHGVRPHTIYQRLCRNRQKYYPNLSVRRINSRLIYVDTRTV